MRIRKLLTTIATLITLLSFASTATAQQEPSPEGIFAAGLIAYISTTTGGGTTTIGGVILTVYLVTKDGKKAMKRYIRDNAVAIRGDISRGGGATVADIADIFGVPEEQIPAFGRELRKQRGDLLATMANGPIDDQGVDVFVENVWEAVASDPELLASVDLSRLYPG